MQLEIPFGAALVLRQSTLRQDYPEVWARFNQKSTVRVDRNYYARIISQTGYEDMVVLRNYFDLWLSEQELIPENRRDKALAHEARRAMYALRAAIARCLREPANC